MEFRRTFTLRPQVTIGSDVEYAAMVHDGTRPHRIEPRTPGGVLRFTVGGQVVFARFVNHPGTQAKPFLDRALRETARRRGYTFTLG